MELPDEAKNSPKGASGHVTGVDGHATGSWTRVTETGYAGPRDGQTNASALSETEDGHSVSASEPDRTGSRPKTVTGTAETAHGQRGSVTNPGESAFVHETANGPWNESATRETCHSTPIQ